MTAPVLVASCAVRATPPAAGVSYVGPIDDPWHKPYGVIDVAALTYGFRVWHARLAFVGDAQVTADETLASLNIGAHASAGLDFTDVTLYRGGARVPLSAIAVPYANVWVHITGWPSS